MFSWSLWSADTRMDDTNINKETKKGAWSVEEDAQLVSLVNRFGNNNWKRHALYMNRNAKQIRERWFNHLDPNIKKGRFTEEELITICQLREKYFYEYGVNKWELIARNFPGRTDNQIKNAWHGKRAMEIREKFFIDNQNLNKVKSKRKKDENANSSAPKNNIEYNSDNLDEDNLPTKYQKLLTEHKNLQDSYAMLLEQYQATNTNNTARCPMCTYEFNPHAFVDFDSLVKCALYLDQCLHI